MGGDQEEVVKEFVREVCECLASNALSTSPLSLQLQSIVDTRPPISKAKMMSITKSALKAIKFYKHIVMNVEKFIAKVRHSATPHPRTNAFSVFSVNQSTRFLVCTSSTPSFVNLDISTASRKMFTEGDSRRIF